MKKLSTKIVTVAFILIISTVSNFSLLAQFGGGNGTENNPYQIKTRQHLEELADSVENSPSNNSATHYNWSRNKYFIVTQNITDTVRTVIGKNNTNAYKYFQGNFDGGGHKIILGIIYMQISVGLFGNIYNETNKADTISISNVITEGYVKGNERVGGIVGSENGSFIKIINCINNCDVTSFSDNSLYVGGIAGAIANNCNIENCINNGKISGYTLTSGIGAIYSSTVENCINNGVIEGIREYSNYVGGIASEVYNSKVISCLNIGTIKGNDYVGGISASTSVRIEILNCKNHGLVVGNDAVGGILGRLGMGTVANCINGNVVEGKTKNVGCIVGEKAGGTVINNHYDMQMCGEE